MTVSIDIAANTRAFQSGVKDAERSLEGLSDVLDDFASDSKDAGRDGERAIEDLGDAAKDSERRFRDLTGEVEDTKRELGRAEDAARDFGRKASDAGDDARRGMDRAAEGVEEFRDEANSTAREAAASFDGSAESIGDALQEVAANAFAGFGPAGAVAGIAAAAGIGLAAAGFESLQEAEEQSRERAAEWAQAYIEAGSIVLNEATRAALALDIITDPDRWQEAQDNATEWGVSTGVAVAAMTGETWALEAAQASLNERQEEAVSTTEAYTDAYGNVSLIQAGTNQEISNGQAALDAINAEMAAGAAGADAYSQYLIAMAQNTAGATMTVDEFGDSLYALPDGTTVYVDAETGQATTDVSAIEQRIYALDGDSATVTANAVTSQAESVLNNLVRNRSATITAHVLARNGVPLPV